MGFVDADTLYLFVHRKMTVFLDIVSYVSLHVDFNEALVVLLLFNMRKSLTYVNLQTTNHTFPRLQSSIDSAFTEISFSQISFIELHYKPFHWS